jgi:hypothetical protein
MNGHHRGIKHVLSFPRRRESRGSRGAAEVAEER